MGIEVVWCGTAAIGIGFILDLLFGDPGLICHPVILMGKLIHLLEDLLYGIFSMNRRGQRLAGGILTVSVILISTGIPLLLLIFLYRWNLFAGAVLEVFLCFRLLAVRSMKKASERVWKSLREEKLNDARDNVSMIVGRDTDALDQAGVIRATVESVAESTSDGIIAPLFYMMLFGATGAGFYKSINTMDSMIGYQNDRYRCFGTAAARLDDFVNFIPARMTGILITFAAFLTGENGKQAWKVFCRDHRNHKSPNSACGEAAMAGALSIRLGGTSSYFGKPVEKPTIGDDLRPVQAEDIRRANRIMTAASVLGCFTVILVRTLILLFI
jgi:adenosylcobinamide-phosphate synthase